MQDIPKLVRYVILTCHSYVTVYIYPRYCHLKSLASYFGLQLFSLSHKHLDEEIYMKQPEGFHIGAPNQVCRLRKSLYGLKQSAQQWNKKLHSALTEMGFSQIESDHSVYIYSNGEVWIIVPIYIDDITLASKSSTVIDKSSSFPTLQMS